ncbi:CobW family GTP-binding protein [Aneurinibacillus terranovensis]|uniref:CobW family GTP-binding protein n=1 Tax=Aneurinibacillus terranovensis TaxID=278991 RepID=UPI00042294B9|nr:GTP-binding protein [Aneurinibacillus terranovensis]
MRNTTKRPVTIITGFLGTGKTTLLSRLLTHLSMKHTAVLVNEFGQVALDHHLLQRVEEKTILVGGGCLCCSVREDLIKTLKILLDQDQRGDIEPIERVVIETSGLADPAPILFTILTDPVLQHHFYVDCVLTTVDAVNGASHLKNQPEFFKQVAVADKIILTKTDMITTEDVDLLKSQLSVLNPTAQLVEVVCGEIEPQKLLASNESSLLRFEQQNPAPISSNHPHLSDTVSVSFTFDQPLDWTAFGLWLSMLLHARGEQVIRVKGLIDVGEEGPVVLNGVQHIIHPPEHLDKWPSDDHRSHVVFIMRSIEIQTIQASLQAFQHLLGSKGYLNEQTI